MTAFQRSSAKSSTGAVCWMPALLTRISTRPSLARRLADHGVDLRASTVGAIEDDAHTELLRERASELFDLARIAESVQHDVRAARPRARGRSPRPMPLVEPVTIADLPSSIFSSSRSAPEHAPRVARDHELFVGRNHPRAGRARRLCDARTAACVRVVVDLDAEPARVPADRGPHARRVLADASGENDRIEAGKRRGERPSSRPMR